MLKLIATVCSKIPSDCPFARRIVFHGHTITIPPLCKLNPFYGKLMELKFWSMEVLSHE
ncbi:MAG: Mo-dependent nitrogenase C-terminal domain-containing protein [Waterburya sp.]